MKVFKYLANTWKFKSIKILFNTQILSEYLNTTVKVFKYVKLQVIIFANSAI